MRRVSGVLPADYESGGCAVVHIGHEIEQELRRQGRSAAWLAAALCCDRTNVYKLFRKRSIDTELLYRISLILRFDFFRFYKPFE